MLPIGEWVLETACQQAVQWANGEEGARMAVNVSPRQFAQQDIVGLVRRVLEDTGLPAHLLEHRDHRVDGHRRTPSAPSTC